MEHSQFLMSEMNTVRPRIASPNFAMAVSFYCHLRQWRKYACAWSAVCMCMGRGWGEGQRRTCDQEKEQICPCRNQRLFCCIISIMGGAHTCSVDAWISNKACVSPTLNGSSVRWCFEHGNAIKIPVGVIFDFYTGLPCTYKLYSIYCIS